MIGSTSGISFHVWSFFNGGFFILWAHLMWKQFTEENLLPFLPLSHLHCYSQGDQWDQRDSIVLFT